VPVRLDAEDEDDDDDDDNDDDDDDDDDEVADFTLMALKGGFVQYSALYAMYSSSPSSISFVV
jgi:hypothetical protein